MARTIRTVPGCVARRYEPDDEYVLALRRGHYDLAGVCGNVRDGHLDTYEEVSGVKSKRAAKRNAAKAFRRIGKNLTNEQLD